MSLAYFAKVRKSVKKLKLEDLIRNLKNALSKAHKAADRDFLLKHLTYLQEKGLDNPATKKDLDFILKDIEKTLGQKLESLAEAPFLQASMEAYTEGKRKVCKPFKIDYSLDDADLGALNILDEFNGWYIRDKFSKDTSDIINRELGDLLERGGTKREFAKTLEIALEDHVTDSKTYWELLADHTLTKIQNMGHVSGYETAGVQYVKIVAVIDNKTTPICRAMNNKVFKVADFRKQYDKIIHAAEKHDLKAYKAAQPMISGKTMKGEISDEDIKRLGIKLPPYHFRCRTTHVAYFEGERELERPGKEKPNSRARNMGSVVGTPSDMSPEEKEKKLEFLSNKFRKLQTNTRIFNYGFESLGLVPKTWKDYEITFAGTNSRGRFYLSDLDFAIKDKNGTQWIFNPLRDLSNAFDKIEQGKSLKFVEYAALYSLHHELEHNRQMIKYHGEDVFVKGISETLNEYVTRYTFGEFLKAIRGDAEQGKMFIENAPGYQQSVNKLEKYLTDYKIPQDERLDTLKRISRELEPEKKLGAVARYIAANSPKNKTVLDIMGDETGIYLDLKRFYEKSAKKTEKDRLKRLKESLGK